MIIAVESDFDFSSCKKFTLTGNRDFPSPRGRTSFGILWEGTAFKEAFKKSKNFKKQKNTVLADRPYYRKTTMMDCD